MKYFYSFILLTISLLLSHPVQAQKLIKQVDCADSAIIQEADSITDAYEKLGYELLRETSVSMRSQYELPIVLPMNKGDWYQFIFIGDASSILFEVRIFDWNNKQLQYERKNHGDPDCNIIDCHFVPDESQYYVLKPLQVNKKKKDMCGYVILLKRTG
jgi:hypothetical protein